jgi:hypothetical protein
VAVGRPGGCLYPALSDFMGLDLSSQDLAQLTSEYALAIPQPVSESYIYNLPVLVYFICVTRWLITVEDL